MKGLERPAFKRSTFPTILATPVQCLVLCLLLFTCLFCGLWNANRHQPSWSAVLSRVSRRTKQAMGLTKQVDFLLDLWYKAESDARRYQAAVLSNGLEVLAIEDERAMFASFAVAVEAGSFHEPEHLPGLAHFCEHMLFTGTKSHPDASDFDRYVQTNGGGDNAYTGDEITVYYFSIAEGAAQGGLERFADFFREPLFNRTLAAKEVHAIDSEHLKNIQSPVWRVNAVLSSLASPESPVPRFSTGNLQTLGDGLTANGVDVIAALQQFWQQHYCPERMKVVSFGPKAAAAQLQALADTFGAIRSRSAGCSLLPKTGFDKHPAWPAERLGKYVHIQGTTQDAGLIAVFYLPDMQKHSESKPLRYIRWVLGHQGEGSMLHVLRDSLDLITSMSVDADGSSAGWQLSVSFSLTEHGRLHRDRVLDVFFAYLASVRQHGVDAALQASLERREALAWDWAEPADGTELASAMAERMTRLPVYQLLWGDALVTKPDAALIRSVLAMLSPERLNVAYVLPSTQSIKDQGLTPQTLPFYGVEYTVQELTERLGGSVARWSRWLGLAGHSPGSDARLLEGLREQLGPVASGTTLRKLGLPRQPREIEGLPDSVSTAYAKAPLPARGPADARLFGATPEVLPLGAAAPGSGLAGDLELWHRAGWASNQPVGSPRAALGVLLRARRPADAPEASALDEMHMQLFSELLGEEMSPYLADLQAGGDSVGLGVSEDGISFGLWSYPATLPSLVDRSLALFAKHQALKDTDSRRFKRILDSVREGLLTNADMPVTYALGEASTLLERGAHSKEELLAALGNCTLEGSATALQDLVLKQPLQLTALALGNLDAAEGERSVRAALAALRPAGAAGAAAAAGAEAGAVEHVPRLLEPARPVEIRRRNPRPGDGSHVAAVTLLAGVATVQSRVQLGLLGDLLGQVAFEVLRTELQLGYVASGGVKAMSNIQALQCYVQGDRQNADEMEAAIHRVLAVDMPKRLASMSMGELEQLKDAFRSSLEEQPYQTSEEWEHWWAPVADNSLCFSQREALLAELDRLLSPRALADAWAAVLQPAQEGALRKIVTVKYFPGSSVPEPWPENQARMAWASLGLPGPYAALLLREREATTTLPQASAAARKQLMEEGSKYYPTTLNCGPAAGRVAGQGGLLQLSAQERPAGAATVAVEVQATGSLLEVTHEEVQQSVEMGGQAQAAAARPADFEQEAAAERGRDELREALSEGADGAEDDAAARSRRAVPRFARSRQVRSVGGGVLATGLEGA